MAPRRIRPAACAASGSVDADILLEWHTDHDLMACDTNNLAASFPEIWNMFENFCAEYAIECVVWEVELRHVPGNGDNARIIKLRPLQVERGHRSEVLRK